MTDTWHPVGSAAQLSKAGRLAVEVNELRIGVFLVDGTLYAINNLCTHGNACLTDGELDGCLIECPLHAGLFDLRSGKACGAPAVKHAQTYPVTIEDGHVLVQIVTAAAAP